MEKNDHYKYALQYLQGKLNERETKEFKNLLKDDKKLQRAFYHLKNVQYAYKYKDEIEFLKKLHELPPVINKKKESGLHYFMEINSRSKIFAIAASVLLLIGLSAYFLLNETSSTNVKLFNKYYSSYEEVIESRSGDSELDILIDALQSYKNRKYKEAISKLEELPEGKFKYIISFYKGMSYLEINDPNKAINNLLNIAESNNDYQQEAQWYLSLAYLKADQRESSKEVLEQILKDKDHHYFDKAESLYNEID